MVKANVALVWALMVVSLCTLAYAAHIPDARNSVTVGGEEGWDALVRGMHFGRELKTRRRRRRSKKSKKSKKARRVRRTRNCNGSQSITNDIVSQGWNGGGGGGGGGGFFGGGGDGGDGGESFVEPQSVNLCVSGESRRNNNQRISINLD